MDFAGEPNQTCEPILLDVFGFHPLAVDDALQETHTPKVDDWGEYIYIVLDALVYEKQPTTVHSTCMNWMYSWERISLSPTTMNQLQPLIRSGLPVNATPAIPKMEPITCSTGSSITLWPGYMPIVEKLDDEIDEIEDQVFNKPTTETLEHIFYLETFPACHAACHHPPTRSAEQAGT